MIGYNIALEELIVNLPMSENTMKELQPGTGTLELGASHAENAAPQSAELNAGGEVGHEENVGSGSMYLRGLAEGESGALQLGAPPQVEHAGGQAEMGGGGDPIDDWVVQKGGYDKLLQQIKQGGWVDSSVWTLEDGTKLSVAEVKRRAPAAPKSPEAQPATPRSVDWKANLPPDQRKRLNIFETKIGNLDIPQLQLVKNRIRELQATSIVDGWQNKEIKEEDVPYIFKLIDEEISKKIPNIVGKTETRDSFENLSSEAKRHLESLRKRFNLTAKDNQQLVEKIAEEYKKSVFIGCNIPVWLFPPHLKNELFSVFGIDHLSAKRKEKNGSGI